MARVQLGGGGGGGGGGSSYYSWPGHPPWEGLLAIISPVFWVSLSSLHSVLQMASKREQCQPESRLLERTHALVEAEGPIQTSVCHWKIIEVIGRSK